VGNRGALSRGAHLWIDPRFGFAPVLNTWSHGCAPRFRGSIQHFAPTNSVTWYMTSFNKTAGNIAGNLRFSCYFAIVWAIDDIKLLQWNILSIVDENKHEPMSCVVCSRIEKAVSFRGCAPAVQKHRMTLGSHPWVRWIGLTGALHDLTRTRNFCCTMSCNMTCENLERKQTVSILQHYKPVSTQ